MTRILALFYGLASYLIGVGSLFYAVGFTTGLGVPKTVDTGGAASAGAAFAIDILLVSLFAVQHSVMARRSFKSWWTRLVPRPVERSTYVLFSGLALIVLFWQWRPITLIVWRISNPSLAIGITGLSLAGWMLAVLSTYLISHFELFGLRQVTHHLSGKASPAPVFRTPLLYKAARHPLYLGLLIAFWAAPVMTAGHLLFAVLTTAYIFVGIMFEERDLTAMFGDEYRRYQARVPMLIPYGANQRETAVPKSDKQRSVALGEQ